MQGSQEVKRPKAALTASIMGYILGALFLLGGLFGGDGAGVALLLGGSIIAMSVLLHLGKNWARITLTVLFAIAILCLLSAMGVDETDDETAFVFLTMFVISVCGIVFSWLHSTNTWIASINK